MTSRNIDERGMGLILRYYYPQAFVMQQDVLFRVSGPVTSGLPGITKNEKESNKIRDQLLTKPELEKTLWKKILSELTVHGFDITGLEEDMDFDEEEDLLMLPPPEPNQLNGLKINNRKPPDDFLLDDILS